MDTFTYYIKNSRSFKENDITDESETYDTWKQTISEYFYEDDYWLKSPYITINAQQDFAILVSLFLKKNPKFILRYKIRNKTSTDNYVIHFRNASDSYHYFVSMSRFIPNPLEIIGTDKSFYISYDIHRNLNIFGTASEWFQMMQHRIYKYLTPSFSKDQYETPLKIDRVNMAYAGEVLIIEGKNTAINPVERFKITFKNCQIKGWSTYSKQQSNNIDLYTIYLTRLPNEEITGKIHATAIIRTEAFQAHLEYRDVLIEVI